MGIQVTRVIVELVWMALKASLGHLEIKGGRVHQERSSLPGLVLLAQLASLELWGRPGLLEFLEAQDHQVRSLYDFTAILDFGQSGLHGNNYLSN